jgi:hypothetical protein
MKRKVYWNWFLPLVGFAFAAFLFWQRQEMLLEVVPVFWTGC